MFKRKKLNGKQSENNWNFEEIQSHRKLISNLTMSGSFGIT